MASITLRLSSKADPVTGRREILIRLTGGRGLGFYAKSEIYVNPDYFEYYVDRRKTEELGVRIPPNTITATEANAAKRHYLLKSYGEFVVRKHKAADVDYHEKKKSTLDSMITRISDAFASADKKAITSDWLQTLVDNINHPERPKVTAGKDIVGLAERYIAEKGFCYVNRNAVWVLVRDIKRYQGFVRATDERRKGFVFDIDRITSEDLEDFVSYLRNEKRLSKEHPQVFSRLLTSYPAGVRKGQTKIEERGDNTIVKLQRNLKSFFGWLNEKQITSNRPFEGFEIGSEHYGDPYYITVAERNRIAEYDFAGCERLETQRDIFVFQCLVGCRVSDLMRLTAKNVVDGVLVYVPHKTKDETGIEARVPLLPKAKELISKYKGVDRKGRLFPFISPQKYNSSIKEIFKEAGVVRSVAVRNSKTGEVEMKPINTVASSHMARRTFVGNAYLHVKDPSLIGKMSGHVEGSTAFSRYRKIEDSTLQEVVKMIE